MAARFTLSIRDFSSEYSTMSLPGLDLTAANFDAQDGLWDGFQTAVDGVIVGNIARRKLLAQDIIVNDQQPVDDHAQRELKWLVRYTDSNDARHTAEIPCPDTALILAGTDNMNLGVGAGQAFKAAFEAVVRPQGTVSVTVDSVILVGRTL